MQIMISSQYFQGRIAQQICWAINLGESTEALIKLETSFNIHAMSLLAVQFDRSGAVMLMEGLIQVQYRR
jgi:hypothetical protein